nr:contains similarity to AMP-binding enzymes (Pfam: AMP-binding.hmm, score: 18.66, 25.90 and 43.55); most similar to acyl-CoA synthetases [Arabidopsis thaliana]
MTSQKRFIFEVEAAKEATDGNPSVGPVYRSTFAQNGFPNPIDGIQSCWDIFRTAVEKYPNNRMLGRREISNGKVTCYLFICFAGKYVWKTYKEVYDIVIKLGNSLRSCGIKEGEKCGIYGINCCEWIISMEACNAHGLYCVPLYDTLGINVPTFIMFLDDSTLLSAGAVEFIISHAEVSIAFVEEKKIPELFKTCPNSTKYMKTVVSFGGVKPEQKEEAEKLGLVIHSWDEFLKLGEGKQYELPIKKPSDICTIMYTSGTTGDPKGVMISNESIVTITTGVMHFLGNVNASVSFISFVMISHEATLSEKDVYISYLPLAHVFDRAIEECIIQVGGSIGFWRGDVKLLIEDLGELKPSIFCAVPRVLDRVYTGIKYFSSSCIKCFHPMKSIIYLQKLSGGGFFKKKVKFGNMKKGQSHVAASPFCDKLVFNKVKQGLGGNVRIILSGAAPLASHIESFLRVVACCNVLQGYGLTESCAGTFATFPDELDMLGTVGPPVPNVDIRLESVPEMNYDALGSTPRGEICIRGKTLFSGYYKREDLTKEVFIDGWLHTGDVGEWQPNGSMKIIDRKKNIFKLAQGEYVAVENLENVYSQVEVIESIWVYGNSFESFLVAIANPAQQTLERWAVENGVNGDFNSICQNAKAKAFILGELVKTAKENKLKGFEIIKDVHLEPVAFDMERDLLTPTYKKKRPQLLKYYQVILNILGDIMLIIFSNVIHEMYKTTKESLASGQ